MSNCVRRGLGIVFAGMLLAALAVVPGSAQVPETCITIELPDAEAQSGCAPAIQFSALGAPTGPRYAEDCTGLPLTVSLPGIGSVPAEVAIDGSGITAKHPDGTLIMGTPGDDLLQGTPGPDCIFGLGGNDVIFADLGFDDVYGGPGRDLIYAGNGDDYIEGDPCTGPPIALGSLCLEPGNDVIYGQLGDDGAFGAAGTDFVDGGSHVRGDITNGGSDGALGSPQTSIDTCVNGERTARSTTMMVEECERKL